MIRQVTDRLLSRGSYALLPVLALATPAEPAPRTAEVRAFVAKVYLPYLKDAAEDPGADWADRAIFTPELRRLIELDRKIAGTEVGRIDADPLCGCQDWGGFGYTITRIAWRGSRALASVRIRNWNEVSNLTLVLGQDGRGGLRIDDVIDRTSAAPSLKSWLAGNLPRGARH